MSDERPVGRLSVVEFAPRHLDEIALQPRQADAARRMAEPDVLGAVLASGMAWTIFHRHVAPPIAIAGILPVWRHRAVGWALIGPVPRAAWPALTRLVRRVLDRAGAAGWHRIDAFVDLDFTAGHRWARALGFADLRVEEYATQDGRAAVACKRLRMPA